MPVGCFALRLPKSRIYPKDFSKDCNNVGRKNRNKGNSPCANACSRV